MKSTFYRWHSQGQKVITIALFILLGTVFVHAQNETSADQGSNLAPALGTDALTRFKCGDALKIVAYPDSGGFPNGLHIIDSDGYVDLPVVGFIKVIDMTPQQLQRLLIEKYATYLPRLSIVVRPVYRVSLLGGFNKPGLFWVDPRESIWSAVEKAGGTQREDGIKKIRWERDSGIVTKNIVPFYQSGASLYSIGFRSGDQFWVTARPRQQFWEKFQSDVLPVLSLIITAASVYATYQLVTR